MISGSHEHTPTLYRITHVNLVTGSYESQLPMGYICGITFCRLLHNKNHRLTYIPNMLCTVNRRNLVTPGLYRFVIKLGQLKIFGNCLVYKLF